MIVRTVLILAFSFAGITSGSPKTKASKEVLNILNNKNLYDKEIFPKESGPIEVGVNMYLRDVTVDDVNMRMSIVLTFRMMWRDYRIKYSEAGVPYVRFADYSKFWIPDPFFKGSIETVQMNTVHPEAYIRVSNRGNITFSTRFHIVSKCLMDLRRFPHDTQMCPIMIASYGFAKDDILFKFHSENPMEITESLSISNYIFVDFETVDCDSKTSTGDYSCLAIYLNLKRNLSTYLVKWYIPCISLVIIAFFSELISMDAILPRLALTLGPLLTLTASSISYSSTLAPVAYTTALDVFTGMSLATIFIICLHVIIGHYYANKKKQEVAKPEIDKTSQSRLEKLKTKLAEKGDYWARIGIIVFYVVFLFLYFLAYSI